MAQAVQGEGHKELIVASFLLHECTEGLPSAVHTRLLLRNGRSEMASSRPNPTITGPWDRCVEANLLGNMGLYRTSNADWLGSRSPASSDAGSGLARDTPAMKHY